MTEPKRYDGKDHFEAMHGMGEEIADALIASGLKSLPNELHALSEEIAEDTDRLLTKMFLLRQEAFYYIDKRTN